MSFKKGALISLVVLLVILLAIATVIVVVFRESFQESGQALLDESAKNAKTELLGLKLALLEQPVGEDECGNALGESIRSGAGGTCDVNNNALRSSIIRDCCCCNVTSHVFDFGKEYAYKEVKFKFVPRNTSSTFTVKGMYSLYQNDPFVNIPGCTKTFEMSDVERFEGTNKLGFTFSCYIRSTSNLEDAKFRYVKLEEINSGEIDYAEAKVYPALRICKLDSGDDLEPGKGYWVFSSLLVDKNVTIPDWIYMSPIAIIHATPQSTLTNEPVNFDGSNSFSPDPSCNINSYHWDFNDSSGSNAQNPSHTYMENGTYKVSLTVNDNCGKTGTSYTYITVLDQYPHVKFDMYYTGFYSCAVYGTCI